MDRMKRMKRKKRKKRKKRNREESDTILTQKEPAIAGRPFQRAVYMYCNTRKCVNSSF